MLLTVRLRSAGEVVGVDLVDHLVLADVEYLFHEGVETGPMARVMYIECFSGAAGDMLLGALVDAGVPIEALRDGDGLPRCQPRPLRVACRDGRALRPRASRWWAPNGAHEHGHDHGHDQAMTTPTRTATTTAHRSLTDIVHLIGQSALSPAGKATAAALFRRLGEAEAAIHNVPIDTIHLHEVGALDSIIDIVGVVFAIDWLGIDDIVASPMNVGGGTVEIAHGTFPVPAPATARLLKGVPIYSDGPQVELTTPTGALLVSGYAKAYGPAPAMTHRPHRLRRRHARLRGRAQRPSRADRGADDGVPDVNLRQRAQDRMRNRRHEPAVVRAGDRPALRRRGAGRVSDPRHHEEGQAWHARHGARAGRPAAGRHRRPVSRDDDDWGPSRDRRARDRWIGAGWRSPTTGGTVRIKVAERAGVVLNAVPEFEDCLRIAEATGRPVKDVQAEALAAWRHNMVRRRPAARSCRLRTTARRTFALPIGVDFSGCVPFLPHDRHRLRQQPAAPRDGLREDRGRRHRPLQAAGGVRRPLRHGQRRALAERLRQAAEAGLDPIAYCDRMEQEFRQAWRSLDISFDDFIRTTQPRHQAGVTEIATRLHRAATSTRAPTRAGTASAAKRSSRRRTWLAAAVRFIRRSSRSG